MPTPLLKNELQKMAEGKIRDSHLLFKEERFSSAYYLGGYAIELGLKACIAKQMRADVIPDKQLILNTYSHDFSNLVGVSGLHQELKQQRKKPKFNENWLIVEQWSPEVRHQFTNKATTQYFLNALDDPNDGVFTWIKNFW